VRVPLLVHLLRAEQVLLSILVVNSDSGEATSIETMMIPITTDADNKLAIILFLLKVSIKKNLLQ